METELTSKQLLEGALEANESGIKTINEDLKTLKKISKLFAKDKSLSDRKQMADEEISHYDKSLTKKEKQIENIKELLKHVETPEGQKIIDSMFKVFMNK